MNKRQKKKWMKRNLIYIKMLRPTEQDIIFFIPNFDRIDIDTAVKFYNRCIETGMLDHYGCVLIPYNIKKMDVNAAQTYLDELQKVINNRKRRVCKLYEKI